MYTITFPIPFWQTSGEAVWMPAGLARDLQAQLRYESHLRVIGIHADDLSVVQDPVEVPHETYPGLSIRCLPWNGTRRQWLLRHRHITRILAEEAEASTVWHTTCSLGLWDLTTTSFAAGRHCPGLRVLCLDSDPAAMAARSGWSGVWKAPLIRAGLRRRVASADTTIFVGTGPYAEYARYARHAIRTGAVWLREGEVASDDEVHAKADELLKGPVRMVLASRLTAWKGVDDVLDALDYIGSRLPDWTLDVIGEGPEKGRLQRRAGRSPHRSRIRFCAPIPYGPTFFSALRRYHLALIPTRGPEEARIVFDAAAAGCALVHSGTPTLCDALGPLRRRWIFEPGNPHSLADALKRAIGARTLWPEAWLDGLTFMRGRTIDEMHRIRFDELASLRNRRQPYEGARDSCPPLSLCRR